MRSVAVKVLKNKLSEYIATRCLRRDSAPLHSRRPNVYARTTVRRTLALGSLVVGGVIAAACSSPASPPATLPRDTLLDPSTCRQCHADHYNDWAASMHAYASDDPVFLAMNKRGQRETNGQLGDFCVKCHAPMALHEGATKDGTDLAQVPQKLHGVTCFFCHTVDQVNGAHDDPLHLSDDPVMRGEFGDPVSNTAHEASYSTLHDRDHADSATMCGACHDIVTPQGAAIERTFAEWQGSVFSHAGGDTCSQCHMHESQDLKPIAQAPNVFARHYHAHDFPAVDTQLPPMTPASTLTPEIQTFLDTTLQTALCVTAQGGVRVILDNVGAGHAWPSGSAQDRRAWIEVTASLAGNMIYESGVVPDGTPITSLKDPDLWLLRDCMFDAAGKQVSMFWQAASTESNELPAQATFDQTDPRFYQTHIVQFYPRSRGALPQMPDTVTMRVRLQPMGLDVLDDLVQSGDLDPKVRARMGTYEVASTPPLEWTAVKANLTYTEGAVPVTCVSASSFNVAADKVPATNHTRCSP